MNHLKEVFWVFFKMGCFAFGGPAAHIAMMEAEVVEKRKWLNKNEFLDLIGATSLIPGPNSTEMTMHCGKVRGGNIGLFIAGLSFILPAIFLTSILAWTYVNYGTLPNVQHLFYGIKPVVLALIFSAILKLGKKAVKNIELAAIGLIVIVFSLLGLNEIQVLLVTGLLGYIYFNAKNSLFSSSILSMILLSGNISINETVKPTSIFLTFLKIGSILYGSGYLLIAYLDTEVVQQGWLTRQEVLDAVAVGQFTPGPVLSTAAFIGFQISSWKGALLASSAIFLPSFLFVLLLNPIIPKIRQSISFRYFLDSVNVAALGVMTAVLIKLMGEVILDFNSLLITVASFSIVIFFKKVHPIMMIVAGSLLGYLLNLLETIS